MSQPDPVLGAWLRPPDFGAADPARRLALGLIAAAGLALLLVGVVIQGSASERGWMLALAAGQAPWPVQMAWSCLTVAGFGWSCFIVLFAADRRDGGLVALLGPVMVLTAGVSWGLKQWLATLRPAGSDIGASLAVIGERIQGLGSTPSGHSLAAAVTSALLVFWFASSPRLRLACWGIGLAGAGVAASRVMVGAHWPSDVLIGFATGLGIVWGVLGLAAVGPVSSMLARLAAASVTVRGQRWVAGLELLAVTGLLLTPTGYPLGWPMELALTSLGLVSAWRRWRRARASGTSADRDLPR